MHTQPIFLLSLPRSGSTLLQRLLSVQPQIATSDEPWLALPALYALRPEGVDAEHGHGTAAKAIAHFCREHLPNGRSEYLAAVRDFLARLYDVAARGERYFLDKTPRYHLVASELAEMFPSARFVFLWRNPLAVAASMIDSWNRGRWNLDVHGVDLFQGVESLTALRRRLGSEAISVRYELLVESPERELARLGRWLELDDGPIVPELADVPPRTAFGDHHGTFRYGAVSAEPLDKWKTTLGNPLRKAWARRYLHWIGHERLRIMGYDLATLAAEIDAVPARTDQLAGDVARNAYAAWCRALARSAVARRRLPWPRTETGWR